VYTRRVDPSGLVFHHTDTHIEVFYLSLTLSLNNIPDGSPVIAQRHTTEDKVCDIRLCITSGGKFGTLGSCLCSQVHKSELQRKNTGSTRSYSLNVEFWNRYSNDYLNDNAILYHCCLYDTE
jgi:hypothetical protein